MEASSLKLLAHNFLPQNDGGEHNDRGDVVCMKEDYHSGIFRCCVVDAANGLRNRHDWAKFLASNYTNEGWNLERPRTQWREKFGSRNVFASVVALELDLRQLSWTCRVSGDSLLLVLRQGSIYRTVPADIERRLAESSTLLSSAWELNDNWIETTSGQICADDIFLLSSDGLGAELIRQLMAQIGTPSIDFVQSIVQRTMASLEREHGREYIIKKRGDFGACVVHCSSDPSHNRLGSV